MPMSSDRETPKHTSKMVLFRNILAFLLILTLLIGVIALLWQWLQEQPLLVQFIGVVMTVLFGVYSIVIGRRLTRDEQSNLWNLMTDYRALIGLMALTTLIWTWYLWNPTSDSTPKSGAETPASSSAPTTSPGDTTGDATTVNTPADVVHGPFKIEGICAATADFDSELAAKTHLEQRAWESATAHYGADDNVRMATIPQFYNGRNLAEICIRVTFRLETP